LTRSDRTEIEKGKSQQVCLKVSKKKNAPRSNSVTRTSKGTYLLGVSGVGDEERAKRIVTTEGISV